MTLATGTKLGRYEIRAKIGAGGMGEVYLAQDTKLDRRVALKILPAEVASNQDRMRRFVQEAKAAAALNHPNIAHIYEIGEANDTHFIAMEFIDGQSLREIIQYRQTDLAKLLRYLQQVAEGLAKAHASGIVHRDLKPDNIIVTPEGYAKILDFGLAKLIEPQVPFGSGSGTSSEIATALMAQHSTPGMVMGTVGYMSPEQAQGKVKEIDHRSDIFSFGCIVYETATGRRSFEGDSVVETLYKIIHAPLPSLRDANPAAPAALQHIVRRCVAKDPDERYQSIKEAAIELRELRQELQGASALDTSTTPGPASLSVGAPSTASLYGRSPAPASGSESIRTAIKRNKVAAAVLIGALILISVGLAGYLIGARKRVARDSIAVLPLLNDGADPNTEYLSDGLTESLINSLSQLPNFRVVARSTVFRYKGKEVDPQKVGRELNVRSVLMGHVRQTGDALTVQVDLVDADTGAQLWGEAYERKLADMLAVKQDITREITEKLQLALTGEEQKQLIRRDTSNAQAYQFYLKGRYYWAKRTPEGLKKAIEEFQSAADKDADYTLAYVGLADCYALLEEYTGAPTNETAPVAKGFAQRALQIDDSSAEAHTSLAYVLMQLWEWNEAEREFKRALSLNPKYPLAHQWYSLFLRQMGRFDEALVEIKRAQDLDPLSLIVNSNIAALYLLKGDLNAAAEQSSKTIELDPGFPIPHDLLATSYLRQQRYVEAIAEYRKAVDLSGRRGRQLASLGYAYALSGQRSDAATIVGELEEKYAKHEAGAMYVAQVYAALGEKDQAFAWLEKAFQTHSGLLVDIRWDKDFDSLRSDPRFTDLLRRIGVPQ